VHIARTNTVKHGHSLRICIQALVKDTEAVVRYQAAAAKAADARELAIKEQTVGILT